MLDRTQEVCHATICNPVLSEFPWPKNRYVQAVECDLVLFRFRHLHILESAFPDQGILLERFAVARFPIRQLRTGFEAHFYLEAKLSFVSEADGNHVPVFFVRERHLLYDFSCHFLVFQNPLRHRDFLLRASRDIEHCSEQWRLCFALFLS